jgi:hypothetical protein
MKIKCTLNSRNDWYNLVQNPLYSHLKSKNLKIKNQDFPRLISSN